MQPADYTELSQVIGIPLVTGRNNLIEEDIAEKFDGDMGDSKLHGDALNKEKRNSQKCVDSNYSLGGWFFMALYSKSKQRKLFYMI